MIYHVPPRLCRPDAIRCPRCGSLQHQTWVGRGSHGFRICDGKPKGERCNAWLWILRTDRWWVSVSAVTAGEMQELRTLLEDDPEPDDLRESA